MVRVAVVAPACPIDRATADRVAALAAERFARVEIVFHPQCFLEAGHFAGPDQVREDAFVEVANDPAFDAVWFARGGYGCCRMAERALDRLGHAAGDKAYLGYSDLGMLLGGLYARGIGRQAHGSHPADVRREGEEAAVMRSLGWLAGDAGGVDPVATGGGRYAAFNLTVLSHMLGTKLEPDLTGHELLLEDVGEHHYRVDRALFQMSQSTQLKGLAGVRLGAVTDVQPNDPPWSEPLDAMIRRWCADMGVPFLGPAEIGHTQTNRVVPFGMA